jgi:hypothetical protein
MYVSYMFVVQLLCILFDCREQSMSSVGFCVINSAKRGYPLEDATHIALRK